MPKWEAFLAAGPTPDACAAGTVGGGDRRLGRPRLQPAGGTTCTGPPVADRAPPRRCRCRPTWPALIALPGDRRLHGPGRAGLRLRAPGRRGRDQHRPGPGPGRGRPPPDPVPRLRPGRPAGPTGGGPGRGTRPCSTSAPPVCTARRPRLRRLPARAGGPGTPVCRWARMPSGPDPAVGSAGTSRPQSPFAGSDRQGRGRLLARLAAADPMEPAAPDAVAAVAGWPEQPARAGSRRPQPVERRAGRGGARRRSPCRRGACLIADRSGRDVSPAPALSRPGVSP